MDDDLDSMSREQLVAEVKRLRHAIRAHRDSSLHELCWHHPALWSLLPERTDPLPVVPEWPQFMEGCIRYRRSLDKQAPDAPRSGKPVRQVNDCAVGRARPVTIAQKDLQESGMF